MAQNSERIASFLQKYLLIAHGLSRDTVPREIPVQGQYLDSVDRRMIHTKTKAKRGTGVHAGLMLL